MHYLEVLFIILFRIGVYMFKKILILIIVLLIISITGYLFFTKVYMSDKNLLNRYLDSKGYSCIGNICTLQKKTVKYVFDIKDQEMYVGNDEYNLNVGKDYPILKVKNGNRRCSYQKDNYRRGDLITKDFSYDKECKEYIDDINKYIEEYMCIISESNVKTDSDMVK